ncbi:MAG: hypothetical protein QW474_03780 [Candidatus Aenigmatarchaeota archaeon]
MKKELNNCPLCADNFDENEKITPHLKCVEQAHPLLLGCRTFIENEKVLIWCGNDEIFIFREGEYEKDMVDKILGKIYVEYLKRFNEVSKYYNAVMENGLIRLTKKATI